MAKHVFKLLSISEEIETEIKLKNIPSFLIDVGEIGHELFEVLKIKNGFYSFESALHFFHLGGSEIVTSLEDWNKPETWKGEYGNIISTELFFAEDIFGNQFCIYENAVYLFDSETGEKEYIADNLEGFAGKILTDYNLLTGYSIAHKWQLENGSMPYNTRLIPKKPFVMGGAFSISNLYMLDSIKSMKVRGSIAIQIKEIEDGSKIKIVVK